MGYLCLKVTDLITQMAQCEFKKNRLLDTKRCMNKELVVKCPHCKKSFRYHSSEFRPFCSEKCKMIDMGHWFDESYVVAGTNNTVYIEEPEKLAKLSESEDED